MKNALQLLFVFLVISPNLHAQLSTELRTIATRAHARVGVACALSGTPLDCNVNADTGLPMQSVYKLPIAMATLHAIEAGQLTLTTKVAFRKSDLIAPDQYSQLQEEHPHGGANIPVETLLRLAMTESDGVASDLLLRTLGGPSVVDAYVRSLGVTGMHIVDTEQTLGRQMQTQYRNDAQPQALVALLRRLADHPPLNPKHTSLLLRWMTDAETGEHRLKALLPKGTIIAHKTGTSGTDSLTNNATNDVGLITLKDGRKLAIAVLVTDSSEPQPVRESVIAQIAKAVVEAASAPR